MQEVKSNPGPGTDHERLLAEAVELERQGHVSQADLAAFEARLQRAIDEEDQRLAARLADIQQEYATVATPASRGWQFVTAVMFVVSIGGVPLGLALDRRVFSEFAEAHWSGMHGVFIVMLVLWAVVFLRAEVRERMRRQLPNPLLRWLLAFPLGTAFMAALTVASIPGWAALMVACAALVR